uniref:Tetrahydromethanopterin S-methyltransferase subunit B n=1 Tax=Candidatus Methanophagaceae archaeon ANME-1 ERB6 TaxID=2759912 RepID=A0A7G9YVL5_9EURY|nr:tetrahydromethanopterin S-methyltransferase subunit B [Methanosarcinales archaeon ANME-1 ERB6]QNO52049.1 tetrahydromethanopterin S-methyltransferase subunit B [Methanosarcinales archaeon ANME-1 ERB6]
MVIVINEKYNVVLDESTMTVGEARPGFYKVSLAPIDEQLNILEGAVDDLFNVLDPSTTYSMAQPNREGITDIAGFITMLMVGLTFGILAVALVLMTYGIGFGGA